MNERNEISFIGNLVWMKDEPLKCCNRNDFILIKFSCTLFKIKTQIPSNSNSVVFKLG